MSLNYALLLEENSLFPLNKDSRDFFSSVISCLAVRFKCISTVAHKIEKLLLFNSRKKSKIKKQEILKNQLIQKAQQYFTNIASIFEVN
jgi:rRNA-processing protein FCF1